MPEEPNLKAICAVNADTEDIRQELSIRLIRAVEKYVKDYGDIRDYIFMELQDEARRCVAPERALGMSDSPSEMRADHILSLDTLLDKSIRSEERMAA